jgi:hypothetical protein
MITKKRKKSHTAARRVSFTSNWRDWQVCQYLQMGLHTSAIASLTGLTESQVTYRAFHSGIRRRDYRDGANRFVKEIINRRHEYWDFETEQLERKNLEVTRGKIRARVKAAQAKRKRGANLTKRRK